jgi:ABC-type branched-subunit amino acid transport system ATPase component
MEAIMIQTRKLALVFCVFIALGIAGQQGCAKAPPTLGPAGVTAFQNQQIQKSLDTIRDIAIDANATAPPVLTTDTTRKVVTWHKSAITVLHARGAGWVSTLTTSLDELSRNLPAAEQKTLAPYIALAKTLLNEVTRS